MEPRQVRSAADARAIVEARKLPHVKVGVFDIDGIMRGKYMSRDKFVSALEGSFAQAIKVVDRRGDEARSYEGESQAAM